jgi:hypothetical protein
MHLETARGLPVLRHPPWLFRSGQLQVSPRRAPHAL